MLEVVPDWMLDAENQSIKKRAEKMGYHHVLSKHEGAIVQHSKAFDQQVLRDRRLEKEHKLKEVMREETQIQDWWGKAREGQVYRELQAEQRYIIDKHWRQENYFRNCADGEVHRMREVATLKMAEKELNRLREIDEFNQHVWDMEIKWRDYEADRERCHDRRYQRFRDNLKIPKLSLITYPVTVNKVRLCKSLGLDLRKLPIHGNAHRAPCLDGSTGRFGTENMYIR